MRIACILLVIALAGCASRPAWVQTDLYLGLGRAGAADIAPAEFAAFLAEAVTPRFPDGFTVVEARGQWRDGERITAEPSRILVVIHPPDAVSDQALEAIRAEYRRRFAQQSVLRVDRGVAASF